MKPWWNDTDRGKLRNTEKSVPVPTKYPTWTDLSLHTERLVTNHLSMACLKAGGRQPDRHDFDVVHFLQRTK
jgi:hypothetical protein